MQICATEYWNGVKLRWDFTLELIYFLREMVVQRKFSIEVAHVRDRSGTGEIEVVRAR